VNQELILHVLGTAQPEGAAIVHIVGAIAKGLDPARYKLYACFLGGDGPLVAQLETQGIEVRVVPWSDGLHDPVGLLRFWRTLGEKKPAIVHQHFGGRALRWVARRNEDSRVVLHLHGRVVENQGRELLSVNAQAADLVIATSSAVAMRVRNVQVQVVHPGVCVSQHPAAAIRRDERGNPVIGTAARLVPLKGIVHLIRAFSFLRSEFPFVRLEIAGTGPEESALKQEAAKLGLDACVRFLGWQSDLTSLFAKWDMFVLPSLEEGFGIALVEAMAAGLPVIGTTVGGILEIVEHGKTGLLVTPGDPHALADQIATLLRDTEERKRLGLAGWARVRNNFSQESMVSAVEAIYERLLTVRPARTGNAPAFTI
jgi:glycosyltransferase involved in cell wall biosynthesis